MTQVIEVRRGSAPLIVSLPHTGTDIPPDIEAQLASPWLARKDVDWWVERLYAFAPDLGASVVRTPICRTVIDVNRDPSGASLYPGQASTSLCPVVTFDGEALYPDGAEPNEEEVARRRALYFDPFHAALGQEIARLRAAHGRVVLYDAHSIRSCIPRLFEGVLPNFNIGLDEGRSCARTLARAVEKACDRRPAFSRVTDGRFKGGWITRSYGRPETGVHAIQMELACRGYMAEPQDAPLEGAWPSPFDAAFAAPLQTALAEILDACLAFAKCPAQDSE